MLRIVIPATELFNENDSTFTSLDSVVLSLEHSLISVSKWESKWCVPFLSKGNKTSEQVVDYIRCMTLTQNVPPEVYLRLSPENYESIQEYINAPMTATIINRRDRRPNPEIITSEIIYYWMVALNIPFECQTWHLNRLLTLVNVCNLKQQSSKKLKGKGLLKSNAAINAERRAALNSRG
jgi:hypothetical protein